MAKGVHTPAIKGVLTSCLQLLALISGIMEEQAATAAVSDDRSSNSAQWNQTESSPPQTNTMEFIKVENGPSNRTDSPRTENSPPQEQKGLQMQQYQGSPNPVSREASQQMVGYPEQNASPSVDAQQYAQSPDMQHQRQQQTVIYGTTQLHEGVVISHDPNRGPPNASDHNQASPSHEMTVYQQQDAQGSPQQQVAYNSSTHSPQPTPQQQEQRVIYESTPVSDSSTNYRSSPNTYTSLPDAPPMYKEQYILSNGTVQKMDSHHVMLAEPNVAPVPTPSHGHTSPHLENCPTPTGSHVTELTPVQPSVYGQSPYSPHIQITLQQRHPGTTNPSMLYASTEEVERYLNHVEQPASVASSLSSHEPQLTQLTPTTLASVNSTYASMPPHQFDSYPTYIQGNFGTSRGIPPYYTSSSPPTWTSAQPPLDPQIQVSSYNSLHNMTQRYGYASTPDIGSRGTGSSTDGSSFSSAPGTRSPNTGLVNYSGYPSAPDMGGSHVQNGGADWPLTRLLSTGGSSGGTSPPRRSTPAPEVRPGEC